VLRLSNRGRYAVRAVFDLARGDGSPVQVKDVASRQRIPVRFLEQIFQSLKRAGLVDSKRGPRGGFTLARRADEVRLGDVLRAVEGPVVLAVMSANKKKGTDNDVPDAVLADLSRSVEQCFDGVTIQDIVARGERLAIAKTQPRAPYVI
jgi:Rrf2 family transcriptional regulator, iron-sulfur cluster assembly transcription factor